MSEDYKRAKKAGLTEQDRRADCVPNHPLSKRLVEFLVEHDFHDYNDYFCWKVGGDGDNGQILAFQMDAFFETLDLESYTGRDVLNSDVEAIESEVGFSHNYWGSVNPKEIIAAAWNTRPSE